MITLKRFLLINTIWLLCLSQIVAQHYPGGVTGAEVWYKGDLSGIYSGTFANAAANANIRLTKCGPAERDLFNFNPSLYSSNLCIEYTAPLENTTGRNVFFVGKPKSQKTLSHLGTLWRDGFGNDVATDEVISNFFDLNSKNLYAKAILAEYVSDNNAHVNFYHTNHYYIDQKFKSYGERGETKFSIGKVTNTNPEEDYSDFNFDGSFPEFISFPKELSANERNRIESYLGLKYGLTLNRGTSYLNSKNIVFWDQANDELFQNRIFGVGKDLVSDLNQLQSESTHLQDHLVVAIGEIMETNEEKQQLVTIPDDHFLVFGDNGAPPLLNETNSHGVTFWRKTWLAQRTGQHTDGFRIHFKLFLTEELIDYLEDHPTQKLWLLQDKNTGNSEISTFDNETIDYHSAIVNLNQGIAYFEDISFDSDNNIYDQFTIGVGPEMIVQAQVEGCEGSPLSINIEVTGGLPPYTFVIEAGSLEIEETSSSSNFSFSAEAGVNYMINVTDSENAEVEIEVTATPWDFEVDLGPDQPWNITQSEITLDAGINIDDPTATYAWYLNDLLLNHTASTLTVSEPGSYEVVVTSGDFSCSVTDDIYLAFISFEIDDILAISGCDEEHNNLYIEVIESSYPLVTTLSGQNTTVSYVHSGSTIISGIPYGNYSVTIQDATGTIDNDQIVFTPPLPTDFGMDIYTQLEALCDNNTACNLDYDSPYADVPYFNYGSSNESFSIDAAIGISDPNLSYEWFINEQPLAITTSAVTFEYSGGDCQTENELPTFTVVATNVATNCTTTQSFATRVYCPVGGIPINPIASIPDSTATAPLEETVPKNTTTTPLPNVDGTQLLVTRIYPNPTAANLPFTYEVAASDKFSGTIEILSATGAKIHSINIEGNASYKLPFHLDISGVYFIKVSTSLGLVKTNKIIIN